MHANIRNNEIIDFNSMYLNEDITRVETTQEMYDLYLKDSRTVIYQDGEIVENPEYKEEQIKIKNEQRNKEIDEKIQELQLMAVPEILNGNTENIKLYNEVISGLEQARP